MTQIGESADMTRTRRSHAPLTEQAQAFAKCKLHRLKKPKIIAIATDNYLTATTSAASRTNFIDPLLPEGHILGFGQDITSGTDRPLPPGHLSMGTTANWLEKTMRKLLTEFAADDRSGMAKRLFDDFLKPQDAIYFWSHKALTAAAEKHPHIQGFVSMALSAPNSPERNEGKIRIHQALEQAGWNINKVTPLTDLGVPALNRAGRWDELGEWGKVFGKWLGVEDFGSGLALMMNGIQYVVVVAKDYYYDQCIGHYFIRLEYVFYDVFGLDDDDLREFGADGGFGFEVQKGFTAWWQLQHQHGYKPLITRIAFEREFRVPVPSV